MLVSHRKRFIYTKTVKTAGTSVEVIFEPYCMNEGEWDFSHARQQYVSDAGIVGFRGNPANANGAVWWNHMPAATIKANLGEEIWNSYFKFCAIRNPFDKAVSAYHFFTANPEARGNQKLPNAPEQNPADLNPASLKQAFEAWLVADNLPKDRDKYVVDGQFCMDDLIRYEALAADVERICKLLDIPFDANQMPTLKMGGRPKVPLKEYYTDRSIQIVTETYKWELDKFGYSIPF